MRGDRNDERDSQDAQTKLDGTRPTESNHTDFPRVATEASRALPSETGRATRFSRDGTIRTERAAWVAYLNRLICPARAVFRDQVGHRELLRPGAPVARLAASTFWMSPIDVSGAPRRLSADNDPQGYTADMVAELAVRSRAQVAAWAAERISQNRRPRLHTPPSSARQIHSARGPACHSWAQALRMRIWSACWDEPGVSLRTSQKDRRAHRRESGLQSSFRPR
jgi:hypothetical protein